MVLELSGWLFLWLSVWVPVVGVGGGFTACGMAASSLPAGQHAEVVYRKYCSRAISIGLPLVHFNH